jgi:DNA-binding Xre family transcriptional regulator
MEPLLERMNEERRAQGRPPLTWAQVGRLLGMSRQSIQNLASNRELKATNTRFLEAVCRFFGCQPQELLVLTPRLGPGLDPNELDRLVALDRELEGDERPPFHVEVLYSEEAALRWRFQRDAPEE